MDVGKITNLYESFNQTWFECGSILFVSCIKHRQADKLLANMLSHNIIDLSRGCLADNPVKRRFTRNKKKCRIFWELGFQEWCSSPKTFFCFFILPTIRLVVVLILYIRQHTDSVWVCKNAPEVLQERARGMQERARGMQFFSKPHFWKGLEVRVKSAHFFRVRFWVRRFQDEDIRTIITVGICRIFS